jgi:hypothetical protein
MAAPSQTSNILALALMQIVGQLGGSRAHAVLSLADLNAGPVTTEWVFSFVDRMTDAVQRLDTFKVAPGLDSYATAQLSGYGGVLTTDIAATRAAILACRDWVVANFPKDSTNTYLLSHQMASDGTRTPRTFSTAATAGLRTNLSSLIATIAA